MRHRPAFRALAALALLATLLAPIAGAATRRPRRTVTLKPPPSAATSPARPAMTTSEDEAARAPVSCGAIPGEAPELQPRLRSAVGLNYTTELLDEPSDGSTEICVLVDSTGTVREAGVSGPNAAFEAAALEAARWWVFTPARRHGRAVPARIAVTVEARPPRDTDPLVPDVIALAADAEARGELREALDAWTGALARVGTHPALQNEWTIREHIVRLANRMPEPPEVPMLTESRARGTHNLMLRNVARSSNESYAAALDEVLRVAPWYADGYRWRASARAASGRRDDATRDVLCFRIAVRDSAGRALADRALVALAAADTVAALTMLKN